MKAIVFKDGFQIAFGRVVNANLHGMFLKCAVQNFWRNQPLEIELFATSGAPYSLGRFKCFLSRIDAQGLALTLFDDQQLRYAEKIKAIERSRAAVIIHADDAGEKTRLLA